MKIHFSSREKARIYAKEKGIKVIDAGKDSPAGKRFSCEAVITPKGEISPKADAPRKSILRNKVVVIINADKTQTEENIESCFHLALDKWKSSKEDTKISRHTAKAELQALFSK